jgi:DNA repair protein RadC
MLVRSVEHPGTFRACSEIITEEEILDAALSIMNARYPKGAVLTPKNAVTFLKHTLGSKDREVFCVVFLDTQNRLIAYEEMFQGAVSAVTVSTREIVRRALLLNASGIIISHCHPSGDSAPSIEDITTTFAVIDACKIVGIEVLDHIVIGKVPYSFRDNGDCFK